MGKLFLYGILLSPAVRATLLTLYELGLDFEFVEVDVLMGDQYSEELIKKNPQHTIPVLQDDGDFISDSHAIILYLCQKYSKDDNLYPVDFYKRAIVDQRLRFESDVIFARCLKGLRTSSSTFKQKMKNIEAAYDAVQKFLKQNTYMAGDHLTIADFTMVASISSLDLIIPIDETKWPELYKWLNVMKQLPYYEQANKEGLRLGAEMLKPMLTLIATESTK